MGLPIRIGVVMLTITYPQLVFEEIHIMIPYEILVLVGVVITGAGYLGYRYGLNVQKKLQAAVTGAEVKIKKVL